ncbi:MAG: agmatinase [Planctomycetota bacterium]
MSDGRTFLGLAEADDPDVLVLPIPYEGTVSYGGGTAAGPGAILDATAYVETWDEELGVSLETLGYRVLPSVEPGDRDPDAMTEAIHEAATAAGDGFLLSLGGEHSVSPGLVRAVAERHPDLSVLHIDAHADLRDEYEGSRNSHACALRRIRDRVDTTVSVGIRAISEPEARLIDEESIPVFWSRDVVGRTDWIEEAVDLLTDEVYLTVDVDGLDPSIMPATGTPEPGGLGWYETLALIRETARQKRIVAADVVELAPIRGMHAPDFLAARLATKIVSYAFEGELRRRSPVQ